MGGMAKYIYESIYLVNGVGRGQPTMAVYFGAIFRLFLYSLKLGFFLYIFQALQKNDKEYVTDCRHLKV